MAPPYPPPQPAPAGPQQAPPMTPQPNPPVAPPPSSQPVDTAEKVVSDVKKEVPKTITEFERLPHPLMAIVGGGFFAIGVGFLVLIANLLGINVGWYHGIVSQIICSLLNFVADIVFGIGLLYCYVLAKRGNWYRAMWLCFIDAVLLLIFGNLGGQIGALIGLIGAVLIFLDENLRHLGQPGYAPAPMPPSPYGPPAQHPAYGTPPPIQPGGPIPPPSPPTR